MNLLENPEKWNQTYYFSSFDDCNGRGDCLAYNSQQMCSNYHVDINIYSGMVSKLRFFEEIFFN